MVNSYANRSLKLALRGELNNCLFHFLYLTYSNYSVFSLGEILTQNDHPIQNRQNDVPMVDVPLNTY